MQGASQKTKTPTEADDISLFDQAPDWWDQRIAEHDGMLTASTAWAVLLQKLGIGCGRFLVAEWQGEPALAMLIYDTLIAGLWLSGWLPRSVLRLASRIPFLRVYWSSLQPVILQPVLAEDPDALLKLSVSVFDFLAQRARAEHLGGIFSLSYVPFRLPDYAYRLARELEQLGYTCDMVGTTRIDLSGGEEAVLARMNQLARRGIRRAAKQELVPTWFDGERDAIRYMKPLNDTLKEKGLSLESKHQLRNLVRYLPSGTIRLLTVQRNGSILAGSALMFFGSSILESSPFATPEAKRENLAAGDLVKWETFKYGIEHGYQFVDLNHIKFPQEKETDEELDSAAKGLNFYKMKWGGNLIYGVRLNWLSAGLKTIRTLKQKLLGG
jgi:hypothetical protein